MSLLGKRYRVAPPESVTKRTKFVGWLDTLLNIIDVIQTKVLVSNVCKINDADVIL